MVNCLDKAISPGNLFFLFDVNSLYLTINLNHRVYKLITVIFIIRH